MLPVKPSHLLIQFCSLIFLEQKVSTLMILFSKRCILYERNKECRVVGFFFLFSVAFFVQNLTVLHTKKKRARAIFAPRGNDFVTRGI